LLAGFLASALTPAAVNADQIFKWVDENGKVHFTDIPPNDQETEQVQVRINSYSATELLVMDEVSSSDKVVMYSTDWCTYCDKAKKYFTANDVPFVEYDIEKDSAARREYDRLGGRGVPVILVGNKRMNGFSVATFERMYNN
jgi:glutaredoxin-like YruB-family protein